MLIYDKMSVINLDGIVIIVNNVVVKFDVRRRLILY